MTRFSYQAIRALLRKRSQVETKYVKNDIVRAYTKYESEAYGPLTRNGYFPDKLTDKYLVKSRFLDTYTGLLELESTLPSTAMKIRLPAPKRISSTKDGHLKRQFRRERDLNNIFKVRLFEMLFIKSSSKFSHKSMQSEHLQPIILTICKTSVLLVFDTIFRSF